MKGRKGNPTPLKVLMGNPGKRPIKSVPEPETGIPNMPDWLSKFPIAVKEWNRVSTLLNNMGIMSESEKNLLSRYCYLESEIETMAVEIQKEGRVAYTVKMDSLGNELVEAKDNPKVSQIMKAMSEQRQIENLLCLNFPSREKVSTDNKPKSKFEGLINAKKA